MKIRLFLYSLCVLLAGVANISASATQIVYVDQNRGYHLEDGKSWATSYRELRTALNAVNPSPNNVVEIWVAKGTYMPVQGSDRTASFVLKSHLRILGGFAGIETQDVDRMGTNVTVLSGDIGAPQSSRVDANHLDIYNIDYDPADPAFADNSYNVLRAVNVTDVVLDQLVITGGHASPDPGTKGLTELEIQGMIQPNLVDTNIAATEGRPSALPDNRVVGGGIFCQNAYGRNVTNANLIINNCYLVNNYSAAYGGAMGIFEANVQVAFTKFHNNVAEVEGGGIWGLNQQSHCLECDFTSNEAGEAGGAICLRTISSDKTMPDFAAEDREAMRQSVSTVTKFTLASPKQAYKLVNKSSVFHKASGYAQKLKALVTTSIGPKMPLTMKIQRKLDTFGRYLKNAPKTKIAADAYGVVEAVVMVGDVTYDLCAAFGADTNNVHAKNWKIFSNGFNTYATPEGLAQLAAEELTKVMAGPSRDDLAFQIKSVQLDYYNQSRYETFRQCRFRNNKAAQGGAFCNTHDNVHIEGCSFDSNVAEEGAGLLNNGWTTPIIMSSWFYRNHSSGGHSGIANGFHARAQILNCTFSENYSDTADGFCVGSDTGSEVKIVNSILWGNKNTANPAGGADIFTATRQTLVDDLAALNPLTLTADQLPDYTNAVETLRAYDEAGGAYGDWVGITEVTASCVQSLSSLQQGTVHVPLFPHHTQYPQNVIDEVLANYATATNNGTLESYGFLRLGEGNVLSGNMSIDPQLTGVLPARTSPVIDAGNNKRFNNGILNSQTGVDSVGNERIHGDSIDMGAIEFQGYSAEDGGALYVRKDATGNNSGLDWANAKTNLAEAMLMTNAEIWVAAGTYYPTAGTDRNVSFTFAQGVRVYGGFRGDETLLIQRNPKLNLTILSGNIGNTSLDSDNSFRVVYNGMENTVLNGFTITKGRGTSGAGMYTAGANALIQNCKFVDNEAGLDGGGLYVTGPFSTTVVGCEFNGNTAQRGGALYCESTLRTENCSFTGNAAGSGGAVALSSSPVVRFYNSLFAGNSIPSVGVTTGAAIYSTQTDTRLYNCTFSLNTASISSASPVGGGAVSVAGSQPLQVENCIFWNNSVENSAAAPAATEQQQISFSSGVVPVMNNNLIQGLATYTSSGTGNISKDPLFTDATTGNFSLRNYSPAIDAGLDRRGTGFPIKDVAGLPRLVNLTLDLGAYEFQGKPLKLSGLITSSNICGSGVTIYHFQLYTNDLAGEYYQWEINRNNGEGFVTLYDDGIHTGSYLAQLTVGAGNPALNGFRYRLRRSADIVSEEVTIKVSPAVIYVKADATGSKNGASWADAYTTLQSALAASSPCSEIWVAAGTYFPTTSQTDRDAAFSLLPNVPIYGGFNGTETLRTQRDWLTNVTVLSGRISGLNYDFEGSKHIVVNDGSVPTTIITASSVLDGFTFVGATDGSIQNINASPTIQNCVFIDNTHTTAIVNSGKSAPTLSQCIFAQFSLTLCNPDAGTTFNITSTNDISRSYLWQRNGGSGFVTVTNGDPNTISGNGYGSTLLVSPMQPGIPYRFTIAGTGYVSPSFQPYSGSPTIMYVNALASGGTHDGTSWANAYTDLALAISNATDCVELWVARGTYFPHPDPTYLTSFQLKSGLTLYGGFTGTETNRAQRNWTLNPTILAARTNMAVINNLGRLAPIDFSSILDGFVFTNNSSYAVINNDVASPVIRNCFFTRNTGICIANQDSHPTITSCTFSNNTAQAINNHRSSPKISACIFTEQSTSFEGGAMRNSDSSPTIDSSVFYNNKAGWGGAIANVGNSSPSIVRCIFKNNSSGNGGAIYNMPGTSTTVRNSLFYNNTVSEFRGGAIADYGSGLTISSCTFAYNSALLSGGGIYLQGTSATVLNSIFWHNWVQGGNGLESGQIDRHAGTLQMTNSIVEGFTSLGGSNNIPYDPLFADVATEDYSLSLSSPAVDAGKNNSSDSADLAGHARIQGTTIDIGAYEYLGTTTNVLRLVSMPESQSTCEGNAVTFTIKGALGTNYAYNWEVNTGAGFSPLSSGGAYTITNDSANNSSTLTIPSTAYSMNGYRFRATVASFSTPSVLLQVIQPRIVYVRPDATGVGNGSSWANAFTNIVAVFSGGAGDCAQVWIAGGTYTATTLSLRSSVKYYGGFAGTETNLNQRNWTNNVTRLVSASNRVLFNNLGYISPIDSSAVLDGFTLVGGQGGAMFNIAATPTIRNCIFEQNGASAVFNSTSADATFVNCTFRNNTNCPVVNANCSPVFTSCSFLNNNSGLAAGGAMQNSSANPTIVDCTFSGNTSSDMSGAIDSRGGTIIISRSVFDGNSAQQGGALSFILASGEIRNCLFVNNTATQGGAAVSLQQSPITIRNCTVTKNSSTRGGGGGILMESGIATIVNSIFWKNRDRSGSLAIESGQIYTVSGTVSVSNSCIEGLSSFAGSGNSQFDPLFQNVNSDFTLTRFSPLIDAGNSAAIGGETLDLNHSGRVFGARVDLGAYELAAFPLGPIALLSTPASQTVCAGNDAFFSVTGYTNSAAQFGWQEDIGTNSYNVFNDSNHQIVPSGNTSTLIISNLAVGTHQYRFYITSASFTSQPFTLTVTPPEIFYVNAAATGNQSGTNWAGAYTNLQAAINVAFPCSQIWVARGTYSPAAGKSFSMPSGAKIYGGFFGNETLASQRNWITNQTVLLGSTNADVIYNLGYYTSIDRSATLDGFTITSSSGQFGINNQQASPTVRNCRFVNNSRSAMINWNSSPLIANCIFTNNNEPPVYNGYSSVEVTNCTFTANHEGGIVNVGSTATISYCLFESNNGAFSGGGVYDQNSTSFISWSTFRGNSAGTGGAIASEFSTTRVLNSLIHDNTSLRGAALDNSESRLTLINCTVAENSASGHFGGISQIGGTNEILNTILWNNTDVYSFGNLLTAQIETSGTQIVSNSCIQGWTNLTAGNFGFDPLFTNPTTNNFRPARNSPVIDAGGNTFASGITVDLDAQSRVGWSAVDIGAYESPFSALPVKIAAQPASRVVCPGSITTFTVVGTNGSGSSFDWNYNAGAGWVFLNPSSPPTGIAFSTTANSSTLSVTNANATLNGYQFRVTVASTGFYSEPATLTVNPPSVIYVNGVAPQGGDGRTWATAFNSLLTALQNVDTCRPIVWVAQGTYAPPVGGFDVAPGVEIYGGFTGSETNLNQRNWKTHATILDGDIGSPVWIVNFDSSSNTNTVFDGFTIRNAKGGTGGGLNVFNANPTIRNCVVRDNVGTALYIQGNPLVENCSFLGNSGASAAITMYSSSPTIRYCVISGNAGVGIDSIYLGSGTCAPKILNCLITGNGGGGMSLMGPGNSRVIHCTVSGNLGTSVGGVIANGATLNVFNSILWNNRSTLNVYGIEQTQLKLLGVGGSIDIWNSCVEEYTDPPSVTYNDVHYDPLFISGVAAETAPTTNGNFHLQTCSPLINAGYGFYASGISTDLDGFARTNTIVDMGAYEFQGAPGTPLVISTNPASFIYCAGANNTFRVGATGSGLSYQWEINRQDGLGFVSLGNNSFYSGSSANILTVTNATVGMNGNQLRCIVFSGGSFVRSTSATLTVYPNRWFVNTAVTASGNGASWAQAFRTIQEALANANLTACQSEIWVAAGNYAGPISLRSGVSVYGGFNGTEASLFQRNQATNLTVVTSSTAVNANNVDSSSLFDGFHVRGNTGISMNNGSPTISNCAFETNSQAIYGQNSSPRITDCVFIYNGSSSQDGSCIYSYQSTPFVDRCEFRGNRANVGTVYSAAGSTVAIANSLFSGNYGTVGSGVYAFSDSAVIVRNCTFAANHNPGVYGDGAVYMTNSIVWHDGIHGNVFHTNSDFEQFSFSAMNVDPLFVQLIDPSAAPTTNGNFHLTVCSPLIDAGSSSKITGFNLDRDGNPRLFGTVDLGAYELQQIVLRITNQPVAVTGAFTAPVQFSIAANFTNILFQWQEDRGAGFINVTNDGRHLGATNSVLTLTNAVQAMNNWQYRCRVQSMVGCTVFSQAAAYHHINISASGDLVNTNNAQPNSNIGVQFSSSIVTNSVNDGMIAVHAMETGRLRSTNGDITGISVTTSNITIDPANNFKAGERIFVTATKNIQSQSGYGLQPLVFELRAAVNSSTNRAFLPSSQIAASSTVQQIATGDVNRDGRIDIVLATDGANSIWLNTGSGAFTNSGATLGGNTFNAVSLADMDGDGWLDLVTVTQSGAIAIWRNNHGQFVTGQTFGNNLRAISVGDINGDGALDIVSGGTSGIEIWINNGAGAFTSTGVLPGSSNVASIEVGDLDRDGDLDLFSAHRTSPSRVWLNDGSGGFSDSGQLLGNGGGTRVLTGDLNGDGHLDVLVATTNAPTAIWLNKGNATFGSPKTDIIQPGNPVASYPGTFDLIYVPQYAIDNDPTTRYRSSSVSGGITVQPFSSSIVTAVRLTSSPFGPDNDPANVIVLGSNDGFASDSHSLLSTNLPAFSGRSRSMELSFANTNVYSHYRVYFTSVVGPSSNVEIGEIELLTQQVPHLGYGDSSDIALGDIDGNGHLDVWLTRADGQSEAWMNDGTAAFSTRTSERVTIPGSAALADVDGDGDLDLIQSRGPSLGVAISRLSTLDQYVFEDIASTLNTNGFAGTFSAAGLGALTEIRFVTLPSHGVVSISGTPVATNQVITSLSNLAYLSATNFFGIDSFTWQGKATGSYATNVFQSYVLVQNVQDQPRATNDGILIAEGATTTVLTNGASSVLWNDVDVDGDTLAVTLISPPAHASITLNPDGTFILTHDGLEPAPDSFTYQINDGQGGFASATVTIAVTSVNDVPSNITLSGNLVPETASLGTQVGTLSATDPDPGDTVSFSLVSGAGSTDNGSFTIVGSSLKTATLFNFASKSTYSIRVRATDAANAFTEQTVAIYVKTKPIANNQSFTNVEDTIGNIVLTASDADGDSQTFSIVSLAQHGFLSITNATVTYRPFTNYSGPDSFTFKANDGIQDSVPATVSINVTPVNDPPVASSFFLDLPEDIFVTFPLSAVTSDPDNDPLTFMIISGPSHGVLTLTNGVAEYQAALNYNGLDSFVFVASDGSVTSAPATFTLNLLPENDAPTPLGQTLSTAEDTALALTLTGTDPETNAMFFAVETQPTHGTLSGTPPNISYLPEHDFVGTDTFTFSANDGSATSAVTATITINVTPVNDPPVATARTYFVPTNTPFNFVLTATDVDGDSLSFTVISSPTGTLSGTPPNLTYLPPTNYTGPDSLQFQVTDGHGGTNTALVQFNVIALSLVVNNTADAGPGSLRAAISEANKYPNPVPWVIRFTPSLANQTISVSTIDDTLFGPSAFVITNNILLAGETATNLTIARDNSLTNARLFRVAPGSGFTVRNLTLRDGYADGGNGTPGEGGGGGGGGLGGAIFNEGMLSLNGVNLVDNRAKGGNGGAYSATGVGGNGGGANGVLGRIVADPSTDIDVAGFGGGGGGSEAAAAVGIPGIGGYGAGWGGGEYPSSNPYGGRGGRAGFGGGGGGGAASGGGGGLGAGGAVFNNTGSVEVQNCLFTNNNSTLGFGGAGSMGGITDGYNGMALGGAIFNVNGFVTLYNSTLTNNSSDLDGGIYNLADGTISTVELEKTTLFAYTGATNVISEEWNDGKSWIIPSAPLSGTVQRGDSITFTVLPTNSNWVISGVVQGTRGTATFNSTNVTYTHTNNTLHPDTFAFIFTAPHGTLVTNIVELLVNGVNRAPVALPDSASVFLNGSVTVDVLTNDSDPDGDSLYFYSYTQPAHGYLSPGPDGTNIVYVNNGTGLSDSFDYYISDGLGGNATGKVSITIKGINFTITNAADSGPGTLRQAIADANSVAPSYPYNNWKISFAPSLAGQTILLSTVDGINGGASAFELNGNFFITATNAPGLKIARATNAPPMRLFHVNPDSLLELRHVTLSDGYALGADGTDDSPAEEGRGGAILNEGVNLRFQDVILLNNRAAGGKGDNDVFEGGSGGLGRGGAYFGRGGAAFVNCTFSGNSVSGGLGGTGATSGFNAPGLGSAIYNQNASINLIGTSITNNTGDQGALYHIVIGSSVNVTVGLDHCVLNNPFSGTDFIHLSFNGGRSQTYAYSPIPSQNAPFASGLFDQTNGAISIPFTVSAPLPGSTNYSVTVSSGTPAVIPNANLSITGSGTNRFLNVTPPANSTGTAFIIVNVADGNLNYANYFQFTVKKVLTANNDFSTTDQNTVAHLSILTNDVGNGFSIISMNTNSLVGRLINNGNGTFDYDPNHKFNLLQLGQTNQESFQYTISDGLTNSTATVFVTVTGLNDLPAPQNFVVSRFPGTNTFKISLSSLFQNIIDPDHDALSLSGFDLFSTNGAAIVQVGANLIYTPSSDVADAFNYSVNDGHGASATNRVSIVVLPHTTTRMLRVIAEAGDFALGFSGTPGGTFFIQYTLDLANPNWITIGQAQEGPVGNFYFRDSTHVEADRFYRIVSAP